jgi:hypothetical protein
MTHVPQDERSKPMTRERPETGGEAAARLEALKRRLREHSPLEDLGPLFGPEARGEKPSGHHS